MKYQFDLLPDEYRSAPRDKIGIFIAVVAIIITIVSISMTSLKNKKAFAGIDKDISSAKSTLQSIYNETNNQKPSSNEINKLKSSIEFINKNLDTPGTDVVHLLTSLEACVPDSVIIKDLTPKKLNDLNIPFTINGEASTIQDILEFANRLNRSGNFRAHLKSNQSTVVAERLVQTFVLEFLYRPSPKQ